MPRFNRASFDPYRKKKEMVEIVKKFDKDQFDPYARKKDVENDARAMERAMKRARKQKKAAENVQASLKDVIEAGWTEQVYVVRTCIKDKILPGSGYLVEIGYNFFVDVTLCDTSSYFTSTLKRLQKAQYIKSTCLNKVYLMLNRYGGHC